MDVFAHALWTGGIAKAINVKRESKGQKLLSVFWAVFWGIMPDLFAFGPAFILMGLSFLGGNFHFSDIPKPDFHGVEGNPEGNFPYANLSFALYNVSHSLVTFSLVFMLVWVIRKSPYYELLGWLLHILIDIPTHSAHFYPTPFLYPFSSFKISGVSWGESWFMMLNYGSLLIFFLYLLLWKRKRVKS